MNGETVQIDTDLVVRALDLLKGREWETQNAAENTYCPSCTRPVDDWRDQAGHHPGCEFVAVVEALTRALEVAK